MQITRLEAWIVELKLKTPYQVAYDRFEDETLWTLELREKKAY